MTDRRAILRRRALFIASGLAVLGCGPGKPGPLGTVEAPSQMPPLQPPPGTPDQVAQELLPWFETLRLTHGRLDEAMTRLPRDCSPLKPDCEGAWLDFAEAYESAMYAVDAIPDAPPCRGTSDDARAYDRRWLEHRGYLAKRVADLEQTLARELSKPADERAWKELLADLRRPLDAAELCRIDADNCARVCLSLHHEDCPDDW